MEKKNILLGVCSSIAAYKSASLAHLLTKKGYNVDVIMTENATKIIAPITFERLTGNRCIVDTFEKTLSYDVKHISLAKKADMVLIAPATANCIGKIANGIADDMLTTTIMACKCHKVISPAMPNISFSSYEYCHVSKSYNTGQYGKIKKIWLSYYRGSKWTSCLWGYRHRQNARARSFGKVCR